MVNVPAPLFRFDIFEADSHSGELRRSGERVRLQEQPFQVLIAMLERPGEIITREDIRQRLWPSDTFVDFDHSLNTAVNKLREALGDTASNPRFIETLPRRGYRFLAPVERVTPANSSPGALDPVPASGDPTPRASAHDLPEIHPPLARILFALLQFMYIVFYAIAFWNLDDAGWRMQGNLGVTARSVVIAVLISGNIGLALRLYTLSAAAFRYRHLGRNFRRIFPLVLALDILWAMAPFFLVYVLGIGFACAASAALVYSPFAQRVLALVGYPDE